MKYVAVYLTGNMVQQLIFPVILFLIGVCGVIFSRLNILITLMCLEVMLLAVNMAAVFFSLYLDDIAGVVLAFIVLSLGAAETAVGLAFVVICVRRYT